MIQATVEMELRLAYNAGMVDGISMMQHIVGTCDKDRECKDTMLTNMECVRECVTVSRTSMLFGVVTGERSPEEFVNRF